MKKRLTFLTGPPASAFGIFLRMLRTQAAFGASLQFTLVELLISIAIIGILASLLLPSLNLARLRSLDASCRGNLRQLVMANQMYAHENIDYFVPYAFASNHVSGPIWIGYQEVTKSPVGKVDLTRNALLGEYYGNSPLTAVCPEMRKFVTDLRHANGGGGYGYNGVWLGAFPVRGVAHHYRSTLVYSPSDTVMFGDAACSQMGSVPLDPPVLLPLINGKFAGDALGSGSDDSGTIHARHRAMANLGWTDGHVTSAELGMVNPNASSQRNRIGHVGDRTTDLYRIFRPD